MAYSLSKKFASLQLDVSGGTTEIFTLSSGTIRNGIVLLHNTTAGAITVSGHIVPSSGSKTDGNKFLGQSLAANTRLELYIPKMVSGDALHLYASAGSSVTAFDQDLVTST